MEVALCPEPAIKPKKSWSLSTRLSRKTAILPLSGRLERRWACALPRPSATTFRHCREKGVFQAPETKGRKRALVTGARPGQIPVIGVVTAGLPILAVENQEGTIPWEDPACFALRVRGDSMINAGILSGDKVIVRPQETADDGQIVVAMIDDEATVKRLRRRNGEIWLMPENENYSPIDGTNAQILGLVKGVVREY